MSEGTLYDKVWDRHKVTTLPTGQDQLFVGLHLIHEVTSPQAFGMLRERDLEVAYPKLTHATVDHIVPTADQSRPYEEDAAEEMMAELEENVREAGIDFSDPTTGDQGIVHVIGPEQGLTQPGKTIVCGDSHTSTHGAFGALAFGIGTSQIRDVLATGTVAMEKQKVRKIQVDGELGEGVEAKDIILEIIRRLGTEGGVGYVYEYAGEAIESLGMDRTNFDLLFLGTNGIAGDGSLTTPNEDEARIKELMVESAERVVLVTDETKFGERSFVEFASLSDVDVLVTDAEPTGEVAEACAAADVTVGVEVPDDR